MSLVEKICRNCAFIFEDDGDDEAICGVDNSGVGLDDECNNDMFCIPLLNRQYIGITGFTTNQQVDELVNYWNKFCPKDDDRIFMIGILVSRKTFTNTLTNPRYPNMEDIDGLLKRSKGHFRVIHYNTREKAFSEEVIKVLGRFDCDGIQLNIRRPAPEEFIKIKSAYPNRKIIFQANNSILPRLESYHFDKIKSIVDYCLVDSSGGRGICSSVELIQKRIGQISKKMPMVHIGLAGGLTKDNTEYYASQFPKQSIDIESGVRTNDKLNIDLAKEYIRKALGLDKIEITCVWGRKHQIEKDSVRMVNLGDLGWDVFCGSIEPIPVSQEEALRVINIVMKVKGVQA